MKRKTKPLVSIITPAYNRADLIGQTIKSVLNQNYSNIEYLVLDDGSTDDTLKIIKKYRRKLVWESHPNVGETRTVNMGFKMAKGDIIGVVNSDDPLLPGLIKEVVRVMTENPKLLVVYPDWKMIDQNDKVTGEIRVPDYNYLNMLRWHYCMPGPGAFFRKSLVKKIGGRDPQFRYVGDFDFWLRAGLEGQFARIPKFLATFRMHPGSASVGEKGELMAEENIRVIEKIYRFPNLPKNIIKIQNEALSSAYYTAGFVCTKNNWKRKYYYLRSLIYGPMSLFKEHKRWLGRIYYEFVGFIPLIKPITRAIIKIGKS